MTIDDTVGDTDPQRPPDTVEVLQRELLAARLELQLVEREGDHCLAVLEQAGINPWERHSAVFDPHPQASPDGLSLLVEDVETPDADDLDRAAADAIPTARWKGERP